MKLLIAEDDPKLLKSLIHILETNKFSVDGVNNGDDAISYVLTGEYDGLILDIMMPGLNGYQTCLEIRKITNAPILFLSAKTKDSDKTLGFSSGGDDYLAKPFSYSELISRVKALIRRYHIYKGKKEALPPQTTFQYRHLTIDEEKEEVLSDGKPLDLTDTEYRMLLLLVKNRKQLFSAERLYEAVWDEPYYYGANNTVTVHIRNLRRKVEMDPNHPTIVRTVWGKGYRCD